MLPFQCYGCEKFYQRSSNLSAHRNKCPGYLAIRRRSEARWKAELEARLEPRTSLGKRSRDEHRDSRTSNKRHKSTRSSSPRSKASDFQIKEVPNPKYERYDDQPGRNSQVKATPYLPLRSMPLGSLPTVAPSSPPTQLERGSHIEKRDDRLSEGR
ncbi:hypothetical protein Clacol_003130 [Clathrus columnatus]|uniref:C2H2-type domain-containing protein n=1 Tax=Clathrus columnatus TaxID=1419009 RepID=A0AAV5A3S0_9AGAM|nr:hypothetical protein Clacol_003130 [Clathrus columnatus]